MREANPLAEVGFEFGSLQDSRQVPIVDLNKYLGLIEIDKRDLVVAFYTIYDGEDQMQVALNCSAFHSTSTPVTTESRQLTANPPSRGVFNHLLLTRHHLLPTT